MNESLNVGLSAEVWTYWKIPLKQEKHPHKWSTIDYNSIIAGTFENILWSNRSSQMWSNSKDWKTGYVIKTGPTDSQLKIKNQIMAYRRTFGKDPQK